MDKIFYNLTSHLFTNYVLVQKYIRLRGQFIDILHEGNAPIELIAEYVGHSKTATTSDIYSYILKNTRDRVTSIIDKAIDF